MHRDPKRWAHVRRLILEEGQSRRGVSRKTGLSRNTIRKMLKSPQPPHRALPNSVDRKLIDSAHFLAAERLSTDPSAYRRRTLYLLEPRARRRIKARSPPRRSVASGDRGARQWKHNLDRSKCPGGHAFVSTRQRCSGPRLDGSAAARCSTSCGDWSSQRRGGARSLVSPNQERAASGAAQSGRGSGTSAGRLDPNNHGTPLRQPRLYSKVYPRFRRRRRRDPVCT